jgi:shikimate kinase
MKQFLPIVLTGFMASGKTMVAGALERLLGWPMIDLDELICDREHRSIRTIIEEDGETFFRERESCALHEVMMNPSACVVALGGGTWALKPNRRLVGQRQCLTVWLDAPFELCWERITCGGGPERPLAQNRDQAYRLYQERRPFYRLSTLHIKADESRSAEDLAAEIVRRGGENSFLPILPTSETDSL